MAYGIEEAVHDGHRRDFWVCCTDVCALELAPVFHICIPVVEAEVVEAVEVVKEVEVEAFLAVFLGRFSFSIPTFPTVPAFPVTLPAP
jgi:hypothetical protein